MFRKLAVATAAALVFTGLAAAPSVASPPTPSGDDRLAVYSGTVDADGLAAIVDLGVDRREIVTAPSADGSGRVDVQVILSGGQVDALAAQGTELQIQADPSAQRRTLQQTEGVFRMYSGEGGILEELMAQAAEHPEIAEFRVIGQTAQGQDIGAVRVTKNVEKAKDGKKPTTVYVAAQHAREWITPEMVRRLLDLYLDPYGTDDRITDLVDDTELWFVPVANPDGYDYTFQEGQRLWRKNLRDNDGDGEITVGDGVDLNRNSATRWGYDNEGSSPNPASDTYRGPSPASEPETQALDGLFGDITPEFMINYHSAAELLLYGIGWQVATPSPDDVIYEAMVGDDDEPGGPGLRPRHLGGALHDERRPRLAHAGGARHARLHARDVDLRGGGRESVPDDEWTDDDCQYLGFDFPDDENLIQAEFEKNIPFALAVAESAIDPDDPVSVVNRDAEDFRVDSFTVSYGDPQTVAVWAKRALQAKTMYYSINGGKRRDDRRRGVGRRRTLRLRERRLLRRVPRRGDGREPGRQRRGVVHGHGHRQGSAEGAEAGPGRERALHLRGRAGHRQLGADRRERGLHGREPRPTRRARPHRSTSTSTSTRLRGERRDPGRLGRRRAGRAARPRRAGSLRRGAVVPRRQPADAGSRGRAHPVRFAAGPRPRGRRAPAVPDDRHARLPQPGRQGRLRRRDDRVLRLSARAVRRHLLRSRRPPRAGVRGDRRSASADCLLLADDFTQYWMGAYDRTALDRRGRDRHG